MTGLTTVACAGAAVAATVAFSIVLVVALRRFWDADRSGQPTLETALVFALRFGLGALASLVPLAVLVFLCAGAWAWRALLAFWASFYFALLSANALGAKSASFLIGPLDGGKQTPDVPSPL